MIELSGLEDLAALRETVELECKLAGGRDGRGAIPTDVWPTYSAFANTRGGVIVLGAAERDDGGFDVTGVAEPDRLRRDLFNTANS